MMGVDTSFLVGLAVREHPAHAPCWSLFKAEIRGQAASMALTPQVLVEFCHVVTDPRRFERPLPMAEVIELCELWWNAEECRPVAADLEACRLFLSWMHEFGLGRQRLLDTLLAASYHRAGVTRLASTGWREFERYGVFAVERL